MAIRLILQSGLTSKHVHIRKYISAKMSKKTIAISAIDKDIRYGGYFALGFVCLNNKFEFSSLSLSTQTKCFQKAVFTKTLAYILTPT